MRRGHAGIDGWRNENPRHFKSWSSKSSHFRSSRNYRLLDSPGFPPPISRSLRPPYHPHSENQDQNISENIERNRHRINKLNRYNDHHEPYQKPHQQGERQMLPMLQQSRFSNDHRNNFQDTTINHQFYDDSCIHINSMGDVDHRHFNSHQRESYRHPPFSNPWAPETSIQQPIERPHNKPHNLDKETYTGHRPPASDHYGCNPTHSFSTIDNSRTFSRSVDDTVDIVRKRLLNRNEPQNTKNYNDSQNSSNVDIQGLSERGDCLPNSQQEPAKKRYQKQKHTAKTNCAKIKNKIVHQLFKMDKEKIHKLMDNPNSSHKFEYAISSLITESQNSFNRHLRSTAEKSLCSTKAEFIENDNNTIYEDTFLKQMQCILDPQDTVFLEDIKPIVMAELTKVLQIDEFEQKLSISEDDSSYPNQEELHNYNQYVKQQTICKQYLNKEASYEEYSQSSFSQSLSHTPRRKSADGVSGNYVSYEHNEQTYDVSDKPYFHRRARSKSYNYSAEVSTSSEHDFYSTVENEDTENVNKTSLQPQYFNNVEEQISEEDDPFAELDQQYHVAVDHDFIENDDISIPNQSIISNVTSNITNKNLKLEPQSPDKNSRIMVDIIDSQLQDTAKSPVKSYIAVSTTSPPEKTKDNSSLQNTQVLSNLNSTMLVQDKDINSVHEDTSEKNNTEPKHITKNNENTDNLTNTLKSLTTTNSRKRSIEQRPSHRKEKRKKLESCQSDSNKQDYASKTSEKCETSKSILHPCFPKEENKNSCKDNKKVTTIDKHYTEKHVKRKETPKKATDTNKRKDSTSSQTTSPIDNNSNISNQTPSKSEIKTKLKTIDMFTEQPRKISIHHAHRNTAPTPTTTTTPKAPLDKANKEKKPSSRQIVKRHVAVQVLRKCPTKETQTEEKKIFHKAIQTDLIIPDKSDRKSNDAFERMKEIDLEIQVLLQEKFKLYNSIESKETSVNSMQTLGMTVLNVDPFDEENEIVSDVLTEDTIVDDLTSLPEEELEKIALESVSEDQIRESPTIQKRSRRRKISRNESVKSGSPASIGRRKIKKHKSPNISLIEQIITDDRPLEDIISLDDLEVPQPKIKTKNQKKQVRKKKDSHSVEKSTNNTNIQLKDCSVVLLRLGRSDFLKYLRSNKLEKNTNEINIEPKVDESIVNMLEISDQLPIKHDVAFVDEIVNDLHLDMLDVSEDIVVGDNCEVKCVEDKEVIESVPVPISEEIILDNSQSSMEEVMAIASQCEECKVYDYSADENLRRDSLVVSGNADAVLAIECVETNFLAACVDGNVYYFNSEGQLITTLRGSNLAVTCLTIVKEKHGTTVYTGSLDSRIRYYDLETGLEKGPECNVLSPIQTMDRAWDTVFVGTRTGFVLQFECKNNMLIPVSSVKFSDQNILALRAMKEGPRKVLLVAARSENVTIKDAQTGLLLRTLAGPKMTVYTLLYEDGKVYCGTSSSQIHVFDYTSGTHVGTHEGGKGAVCLRASGGLLFAGCYDGCVYVYKEGEGQPFAQIRGPSLMLLSLAIVGSKIIAGYKDRSLYMWKIPLCILQEMIL